MNSPRAHQPPRLLPVVLLLSVTLATATPASDSILHSFGSDPQDGAAPVGGLTCIGSNLYGTTTLGGTNHEGTVFTINTPGTGYRLLRQFAGGPHDGGAPGSLLLLGGRFYGATFRGGATNAGTLFALTPDGSTYSVLHDFTNRATDGAKPLGPPVLVGSKLFGATLAGNGLPFGGLVFAMDANGQNFSVLHDFSKAAGTEVGPSAPLAVLESRLYGTTVAGGSKKAGAVFAINADGTGYTNLHHFTRGPADGEHPEAPLILAGTTLYGTTCYGGSNDAGIVFALHTDGTGYRVLHHFPTGHSPAAVPLLRAGAQLYGVTFLGGTANRGTVFTLTTNGTGYATLHQFAGGPADGSYPDAPLILVGSQLFGTTRAGGAHNRGTIFAVTLSARSIGLSGDLAFGNVPVNATAQRTLIITNTGNAKLNVTNLVCPEAFHVPTNWHASLAIGAATNVPVTFHPTKTGNFGGALHVASDATSGTDSINLTGTAAAAALRTSGNLDFGLQPVKQPQTRQLTVTNAGSAVLTVRGVASSAQDTFAVNWPAGTALLIAPNAWTNLPVTFTAPAAGNHTATLTLASDAPNSPVTVTATGAGAAPVVGLVGDMNFPGVRTGATQARPLIIANHGNAPLNITGITAPSPFSTDWAAQVIPAGSQQVITVTFAPQEMTAYSNNLVIVSDATNSPTVLALTGTGAAPVISTTNLLDFGIAPTLKKATNAILTIKNIGTAELTITNMNFVTPVATNVHEKAGAKHKPEPPPVFGVASNTTITIPANNDGTVTVSFTPLAKQSYSSVLQIWSDATNNPYSLPVHGGLPVGAKPEKGHALLWILLIVLLLLAGGGAGFFIWKKKKSQPAPAKPQSKSRQRPPPAPPAKPVPPPPAEPPPAQPAPPAEPAQPTEPTPPTPPSAEPTPPPPSAS